MSASVAEVLRAHGMAVRCEAPHRDDAEAAKAGAIRAHLIGLARAEARDPELVRALTDAFLHECGEFDDGQLSALLGMLADGADRNAGRVPAADTAGVQCRHCGPVFTHPAIAACLPVGADGWPVAIGCPWCFVRGVAIPRPAEPWRAASNPVCPGFPPAPGQSRDAET